MSEAKSFRDAIHGEPSRDWQPIGPYVDKSYLDYSLSVILSRAIPDVRDGLKPVHRRILFAMNKLGLGPATVHKKSARVVGDVIGKYHPHGDASVYDAMVLMSQDFSLRHPMIDGQGNWGSIDGDSPAAMRYTECRMSSYSKLLLEEIGKGTVDFRPNYDGNDEEPVCLPARLPMALLNDQTGIAVGMAADIPGHNLAEVVKGSVALFKNPNTTLRGLMRSIKGPDFPCGGQVTTPREELAEIYETGRGMLTVRGSYEIKKDADGWHMVFTELPPKVSPEQILQELDAISNPQPKKKKKGAVQGKGKGAGAIDPEQRAAKQALLSRVTEINNGAGNDTGPVYIEIYPKSNRQKPEELANYLYSVTSLETRVKVNMNLLNLQGLPAQMGLLDILRDWNEFRFETVTRRTKYRLEKVEARLHILEGFLKVLIDIDEVIRIIRGADNDQIAKAQIMEQWALSEIQADKILDMKLRQLTKLDELAIEKEAGNLREERAQLTVLLDDYDAMIALIIEELESDSAEFGTPRRTVVEEAERAVFDDSVVDEPVTIILSRKGFVRSRVGHNIELDSLGYKDGDSLHSALETRSTKSVILFDTAGRAYTLAANLIPGGRGDGVPITSLIDIQDRAQLVSIFAAEPKEKILLASSVGYGFVTEIENLLARNKAGKAVLNTAGGTSLVPVLLNEKSQRVGAVNTSGFLVVFELAEVGEYPKGKGNKLLQLKSGEELASIAVFGDVMELPPKRGKSLYQLKGEELEGYLRKRGSRGRLLPKKVAPPPKKSDARIAVQDELF